MGITQKQKCVPEGAVSCSQRLELPCSQLVRAAALTTS